ncbi:MAG: hypothetical protein U0X39_08075 [Bacteroidales bacterium]
MKRILIILSAIVLFTSLAEGQIQNPRKYKFSGTNTRRRTALTVSDVRMWKRRRVEVYFGAGPSLFFGDIGGFSKGDNILGIKDLSLNSTRFNVGTGFRYRILDDFSARFNLGFGNFHTTDDGGVNETRGFESKTLFVEPSILAEYYFIKYKGGSNYTYSRGKRRYYQPLLSGIDMYMFAGIGAIAFTVNHNDIPVVGTTKEGGFSPVIPVGIGINKIYSRYLNFGLEVGGRYAFSDYLEGYSSEFSRSKDIYYFVNLSLTYKMATNRNGWPTFKK